MPLSNFWFDRCGHVSEVKEFNEWLGRQPHKYKIVIAGNHELRFKLATCLGSFSK